MSRISKPGKSLGSELEAKLSDLPQPAATHVRTLPPTRRFAFWLVLVALFAFVIEGGAWATVQVLLKSSVQYLFWDPDLTVVRAAWKANANAVDDELGWPSPSATTNPPRDASGAKYNPDFPIVNGACISAFGDSFVWGDEIPLADGWIEQLSRLIGCRVSNFGVSNYGTDQAYIRFRRLINNDAPVALLGIFPDDIVRNVNQYRGFMGAAPEPFWVKGRFLVDRFGRLEWIERPNLDADNWVELHRKPALFLPREYLLPDTHDGPVTVHFPYTLTLARIAIAPRIWSRLSGRTPWSEFYNVDHPSGAVPLTVAIANAFVREAQQRSKRAFIVMLPGAGSFREVGSLARPDYAPLVTSMAAQGIDVFDPVTALTVALNGRSYCELYVEPVACKGHFGVAGSALVAKVVAEELRRRHLIN